MAHFNDQRLPEDLELGAVYGPEYATAIAPAVNGTERRNRMRDGLCVGDLSFAPRLKDDYPELLKFFRACNGKFNSFRFKDYTDFECAITEGVVLGLTSTTFQLQKKYVLGSNVELRTIQQPIAGIVLKNSGSTLVLATDYTLDTATGIVTSLTGPFTAANLTWSGEFDNAVRFDSDRMATSFAGAEVFTWGGIPIKEVPL